MTQIKLSCGFEAEVDETAIDDFAFLEAVAKIQDGDITAFARIARMLLKPEDKARLMEALKDEKGRVPVAEAVAKITELLEQLNSKKN